MVESETRFCTYMLTSAAFQVTTCHAKFSSECILYDVYYYRHNQDFVYKGS